jgi:predicted secreted Zn-dependent protease
VLLPIVLALGLAGQQPRDVRLIINTERLGRTRKYGEERVPLRPIAPGKLAKFSDVPNVTVTYYDISGRDVEKIHRSVAKLAPRDPQRRRALPATSSWTVGVTVHSLTTNKRCTVLGATLDFRAAATMPRLLPDKDRPAAVTAAWGDYVARLESRQAEQLRFAYGRLDEIDRAIFNSRCDKAEAAADAALARLQQQQRATFAAAEKDQPMLRPAQ